MGRPDETEVLPGSIGWVFAHYAELALGQTIVGVLTAGVGLAVLGRARWSRRGGQLLVLGHAVAMLAFAVWMATWIPPGGGHAGMVFRAMWLMGAGGGAATFILPLAVAAWLLRKPEVRQWYEEPEPQHDGTR